MSRNSFENDTAYVEDEFDTIKEYCEDLTEDILTLKKELDDVVLPALTKRGILSSLEFFEKRVDKIKDKCKDLESYIKSNLENGD